MPHSQEWLRHLSVQLPRMTYTRAALEAAKGVAEVELGQAKTGRRAIYDEYRDLRRRSDALWEVQRDAEMRHKALEDQLKKVAITVQGLSYGRLPLQDFPPEILRLIFVEVVNVDISFRWVAMAVCRKWRLIATSTSAMWSTLYIRFGDPDAVHLHCTREALSLGRQFPLDVELLFHGRSAPHHAIKNSPTQRSYLTLPWANGVPSTEWGYLDLEENPYAWPPPPSRLTPRPHPQLQREEPQIRTTTNLDYTFEYTEMLMAHMKRWRTLNWRGPAFWDGARTAPESGWLSRRLDTMALPHLQRICFDVGQYGHSVQPHPCEVVRSLCSIAVNLASLALQQTCTYPISSNMLRTLVLEGFQLDAKELIACLQKQCLLKSLRLRHVSFTTDDAVDMGPSRSSLPFTMVSPAVRRIVLPTLRDLFYEWNYDAGQDTNSILALLACPKLRSAALLNSAWDHMRTEFTDFFQHSPNIERIVLNLASHDALESVFQSLSSVQDFIGLMLGNQATHDTFFSAASSEGSLVSLRRVSLRVSCEIGMVLNWIRHRPTITDTVLETFCCHMSGWVDWDQASVDCLEKLVSTKELNWIDELEDPFGTTSASLAGNGYGAWGQ